MAKRNPKAVQPNDDTDRTQLDALEVGQPLEIMFQAAKIRSLLLDGEPWFVAKDVCAALDLADVTTALRPLDEDEKRSMRVLTAGGLQEVNIIDESGLAAVAFASQKPEARRFRKWVTREVLPALRRGQLGGDPRLIPPVGHVSIQDLEDGTYVRHFYSPEVDALALATALLGPLWRRYRLLDGMSSLNEHSNVSFQLGEAIQLAEHIAVSAMRTKRELIDRQPDPEK